MTGFIERLEDLPIIVDRPERAAVLQLPTFALKHNLTVYDAAYLELALRMSLPIATQDHALRRAMAEAGVELLKV